MKTPGYVLAGLVLFGSTLSPVFAQAPRAGEKLSLKHKFRKADATRVTTAIDMTMQMKTSGPMLTPIIEMKHALLYEMVYDVTDVTREGNITLELTYDRIKQTTTAGGTTMTADSKDEAPDESKKNDYGLWVGLKMMVGLKLTVSLDRNYRVKEVKGFDAFRKNVMGDRAPGAPGQGGLSGAIDNALRPLAEDTWEWMYGERLIRDLIDQWFTRYAPPREVAMGQSWTSLDDIDVPMFGGQMVGKLQVKTTDTLLGVEQRRGKRCAKSKVASPSGAFPAESFKPAPGLDRAQVNVRTCNVDGVAWFDLNGGGLVESALNRDIAIVIQVPAGSAGPGRSDAATRPDTSWTTEMRIQSTTRVTASPEPSRPTP